MSSMRAALRSGRRYGRSIKYYIRTYEELYYLFYREKLRKRDGIEKSIKKADWHIAAFGLGKHINIYHFDKAWIFRGFVV